MASSSDASIIEPSIILRPASFLDPWFEDAFSRDTDTLTRALQVSLSSPESNSNATNTSLLVQTPQLSNAYSGYAEIENVLFGDEDVRPVEALASKQRQRNNVVASGKVAKRKSRDTKRSQTTFITVDTASFRQMVQQVTGSGLAHNPVINTGQMTRPEPHRPDSSNGSLGASAINAECLPTLDTSALLLDQQHATEMAGQGPVDPLGSLTDDLEPLVSFPTLDSWNSM